MRPCEHEALPDLEPFEWPGRRCWVCGRLIAQVPRLEWDGRTWVSRTYWRHRADEIARERGGACLDAPLPPRPPEPIGRRYDRWICTSCGGERLYPRSEGRHGGPSRRGLDRRYGWDWCRRKADCNPRRQMVWNSLVVDRWRDPALFRHESAPNPEQPVQDDPSLLPFIKPQRRKKAA